MMSKLSKEIIKYDNPGIILPDGIIFPDIKDKKNSILTIKLPN